MNTDIIKSDHPVALPHALDVLRNGGLVAFPTDTVYGLAALPTEVEFVERLYTAKGRESTRAIAILLSSPAELAQVTVSPSKSAMKLAEKFWPGPLTIIIPRHPALPDILSPNPNIGVRIPDHDFALQLLKAAGPLGVTSANISGRENTLTAQEVVQQLDGKIHLVIDGGESPGSVPSTVIDCTTPKPVILRPGPISQEEVLEALSI
ncbi:MAG: threonylcarbamoyl-AMP synthase [Chloroflexota bacterium]|jgi:L-threonylcarbamoyladenylate synthase|nr:MAG: threonylcarbamoyl-AMP synthase [Chloroflexota bacterium]UCF27599.1 MAG: threonylcarbamoyl-AMP synthase [Chloroflexota bacterium]